MTAKYPISALAFITNGVSAEIARSAFAADGYDLSQTMLVKQRHVPLLWDGDCAEVVEFMNKPSLTLFGQVNMIGFYRESIQAVRNVLNSGTLKDIYIPNVDNLVCNHVVRLASADRLPGRPRLSVIAEGFMNYQDIGLADRASWRWRVKPILGGLLGLRYRQPTQHLSGAFEPEITRVFSYSSNGLKAPPEKVRVVPYSQVTPTVTPSPRTALLVMTGIAQWMTPQAFAAFRQGFAEWMNAQGFDRVLIKPHPHYPSGGVEALINHAEPLSDSRRLEEMAAEIPAQTIVGYCTTGLVTLKLMRPDLRFIDWGSDYYCEHAYHGDRSVVAVLRSAGVEIAEFGEIHAALLKRDG